jgi:hypothetical protein
MNWLRATFVGTSILLFSLKVVIAQEQSPFTENNLSKNISVTAVILGPFPPYYPPYTILPNTPLVNGVPISTEAGSDTVIFKGVSYPGSIVTLLKNGVVITEVPASPNGIFEVRLRYLNPGTYTFGIRAEDSNKLISKLETFTIFITSGVTTLVDGIFIAPTITTDKSEVNWGEEITIRGMSAPNATVSILVNSETKLLKKTTSSTDGSWSYGLDSSELEIGDHITKARSIIKEDLSSLSEEIGFIVGSKNRVRVPSSRFFGVQAKCDLNSDTKINLEDFSIMAYWYKRDNFPATVDLNNDGTINLTDFSILAYCWTG